MIKIVIFWSFFISLFIESALLQSPLSCGVPKTHRNELIVHGRDTSPGDWPWHAAIYHRIGRTNSYACGGTLISDLFVVTVAHCVLDSDNGHQLSSSRVFVRLGLHNLDALNCGTLQQHAVQRIHQPSSDLWNQNLRNDIALLELATVAKLGVYVQPACVSLTRDLTGQLGTVVGWGVTENDAVSATLKSAQIPTIDPVRCLESDRELFGATLDEGIFCAGYTNGTSVCNGDSGGGIFYSKNNVWYLGGIVSFSGVRKQDESLCYTKGYTAFTKVLFYLPWIASITGQQFIIDDPENDSKNVETSENHTNLLSQNCGVYRNQHSLGQSANVFEFPWMAILQYDSKPLNYSSWYSLCLGTLINRRYVLTIASCVQQNKLPLKVILGEHTLGQDLDCSALDGDNECAPPVRDYGIESIVRHQNFSNLITNDIALIRLDGDVVFEDHISPICLPVTPSLSKLNLPRYVVSGWGTPTYGGDPSPSLLKASVTSVSVSKCKLFDKTLPNDNFHCLDLNYERRACIGDRGAALGYPVQSLYGLRFVQFGLSSYSRRCGVLPTLYTKVAKHMDWLMANMKP